ncbi:MAG TPA: protein-glutamate O-methyltransferase CheR [Pirellulales bacterium]|nr:protein-glutamate O-methyltransferase CheR [Pirellulales bacterium]
MSQCEISHELDAIPTLLEAIVARYGFDFRDYAPASLRRRIAKMLEAEQLNDIPALQRRLLADAACMERFLLTLSVNTTSMFRDPGFHRAFREQVVPHLRTYPFVRIWHAGCSTGEEVYSTAIILAEEGLYSRCRIYATDMNEAVLAKAQAGVYPLSAIQEYTQHYIAAGGKNCFSDYYVARYDYALLQPALRQQVVFAPHNLVTDGSFNEFQMILCRNVLIYFNHSLQERVHRLLYSSLCPLGFLALGMRESMSFTPHESQYDSFDCRNKIYRRNPQVCTKSSSSELRWVG